jgi:hypothetical protein
MKIRSIFVIVLGLITLVMLTPAWADGEGGTNKLIKNQHIYGDLGGEFWEWAFDNEFEMFADGEVDCSLGQSGKVWFLQGPLAELPNVPAPFHGKRASSFRS